MSYNLRQRIKRLEAKLPKKSRWCDCGGAVRLQIIDVYPDGEVIRKEPPDSELVCTCGKPPRPSGGKQPIRFVEVVHQRPGQDEGDA